MFALYGTWGPLGVGKIPLRGVGTICPPGEYHSITQLFELFVCCPSDARSRVFGRRKMEALGILRLGLHGRVTGVVTRQLGSHSWELPWSPILVFVCRNFDFVHFEFSECEFWNVEIWI